MKQVTYVLAATCILVLLIIPLTTAALKTNAAQQGYHDVLYVNAIDTANTTTNPLLYTAPTHRFLAGGTALYLANRGASIGDITTPPSRGLYVHGNLIANANAAISGSLQAQTITANTQITSQEICLTGDGCVTSWPTSGGGSSFWSEEGGTSNIYYDSGNVGVGTASPDERLHVGGAVKIDGSLYVEGKAIVLPRTAIIEGDEAIGGELYFATESAIYANHTSEVQEYYTFMNDMFGVRGLVMFTGSGTAPVGYLPPSVTSGGGGGGSSLWNAFGSTEHIYRGDGNVGIGSVFTNSWSPSPQEKLDVRGNIRTTETIRFSTPSTREVVLEGYMTTQTGQVSCLYSITDGCRENWGSNTIPSATCARSGYSQVGIIEWQYQARTPGCSLYGSSTCSGQSVTADRLTYCKGWTVD